MFINTTAFLLVSPLSAALAVSISGPRGLHMLTKRTSNKQLADGTTSPDPFGYLDGGLEWTSSGALNEGCPSSIKIDDCYTLELSGDVSENLSNGKPRQRIEFYEGKVRDGRARTYKWKYYLDSKTGTYKNFFHLTQLFSDGVNSPIITLSAQKDKVFIKDILKQGFCPSSGCPSVDLADYTDRVTEHTMDITFGPTGQMQYTVVDADSGNTLIDFSAKGYMGNSESTVKYGMYRRTHDDLTPALAYWGNWSQVNVTSE